MGFWPKVPTVYIMSNRYRTVFYVGVTGYPWLRIPQHKMGIGSFFTSLYRVTDLVYFERLGTMKQAIKREKQLKRWRRQWKLELIRSINPEMKDLSEEFNWWKKI